MRGRLAETGRDGPSPPGMVVTCHHVPSTHNGATANAVCPSHDSNQIQLGQKVKMDGESRGAEQQAYAANLDYTLKELQRKVKEYDDELERVRRAAPSIAPYTGKTDITNSMAAEIEGNLRHPVAGGPGQGRQGRP